MLVRDSQSPHRIPCWREEQRKRFLERINNPAKHWKFAPADLQEREYWDEYMDAYEACLNETSAKSTWLYANRTISSGLP